MPFRMVSGVGRGMGIRWGSGRRRGRGSFRVKLGRPIATNGDFVAWICESDALFPNDFGEDVLYTTTVADALAEWQMH